jgi:hypothetical protein
MRFAPAFGDDVLGSKERNALQSAVDVLIDDFLMDAANTNATDWSVHNTAMSSYLPPHYLVRFSSRHARQFLVATISVAGYLVQPHWPYPSCLAEELALRALIEMAQTDLELHGWDEGNFDAFIDTAYMDVDFELLFDPANDGIEDTELGRNFGMASLALRDWAKQYGGASQVHPYLWQDGESLPA